MASEAEYLAFTVAEERAAQSVRAGPDTAMPGGSDIVEAVEAVAVHLVGDSVEVERVAKKGRRFDTRSAVVYIDVSDDTTESESEGRHAAYAILRMVVRHTQPAVRLNNVLTGLHYVADLAPPSSTTVTRLAQGPLDEVTGAIADPLTVDRSDAQATSTGYRGPVHRGAARTRTTAVGVRDGAFAMNGLVEAERGRDHRTLPGDIQVPPVPTQRRQFS